MLAEIRFQNNDEIPPIRVNGSWEFAEHICKQYGDRHGFVPHNRLKIVNRSGNIFVSYVGTMRDDGYSGILYIGQHNSIDHEGEMFEEIEGEEFNPYVMDEYMCDEEDWRPDADNIL